MIITLKCRFRERIEKKRKWLNNVFINTSHNLKKEIKAEWDC